MKKYRTKRKKIDYIDLKSRKTIEILHNTSKNVSDKKMEQFQERLVNRYKEVASFTQKCFEINMELNKDCDIQKAFDAVQTMKQKNEILEIMLNHDNKL